MTTDKQDRRRILALLTALFDCRELICSEWCDPDDKDTPHCEECLNATTAINEACE